MRIKRLFAVTAVVSLMACFAVIPAGAADGDMSNWIEVSGRFDAQTGVQFDLTKLFEGITNFTAGEYTITFSVEPKNSDPDFAGIDYKIVTRGGIQSPRDFPYVRFTGPPGGGDIESFAGEHEITANIYAGALDSSGRPLISNFLLEAERYGHRIALNSQFSTDDFYIKNVVVNRTIDEVTTTVYELSTDAVIQGMTEGDDFIEGERGFQRLYEDHESDATYKIARGPLPEGATPFVPGAPNPPDNGDSSSEEPSTGDEEPPSGGEEPSPGESPPTPPSGGGTSAEGGVSPVLIILIALVAASLLGATGGAFVLMKNP
ncbi:MAG: hypothetical protein LBC82_03165 [Oscillospiraceae bacterium]|jgi:hypothetical protein|nr:hypothetical protein [Oscillospiraceae bacterium]